MKLDYIADNTGGGEYPDAWPVSLLRLFDFDEQQNQQLMELLSEKLLRQQAEIELAEVSFISSLTCRLRLRLADADAGILKLAELNSFACDLTAASYQAAITSMRHVGDGHIWLTNAATTDIELLYSAGGTW